ncbi:hypothetical protein IMAU80188_03064 [Lactiplantibacillus plantarum]|nr:hypothetical protein [Lactiplantibacillus plantarum]MCG0832706.1 hypothetical protein [Lactiplantibacillus plantarum]MCG0851603.1 hypothetical protein [Lactiplantibacillus plantarum]MCG0854657.1 hypothetical protein [Lactiplantibacillus plantarum]MCG0872880.1 hypothetical protein [Lactiplantibacillus plantarum]
MKILKSYYIESINPWIICVDGLIVNTKTKDAIRKQVLDQYIGKSDAIIDPETVAKVIKHERLS